MNSSSLIARGFVVQATGKGASLLISLATLTLTTRYLGSYDYGLLTTAVLFAGLFEAFAGLDVATVVVRRVTQGRGNLERLVGLQLGISLTLLLPIYVCILLASLVVYPDDREIQIGVAILAVGVLLRLVAHCYRPPYQVAVKFGGITASDWIGRLVALGLTAAVVVFDWGLTAIFVVQVSPFLVQLVVLVFYSRRFGRFRPAFAWPEAKSLIWEALPLAAIAVIGIVYYRIDGVLLSVLTSPDEVGAYGLAYRLVANVGMVSTLLAVTVMSTLSRRYSSGPKEFGAVVGRTLDLVVALASPILLGGIVFAGPVLAIIAPQDLAESATRPAQWLLAATAISFVNEMVTYVLIVAHRQRSLIYISVTVLAFNIVLNLLLIPVLAATGSAVALTVTELVSVTVALVVTSRVAVFRKRRLLFVVVRIAIVTLASLAVWIAAASLGAWPSAIIAAGVFTALALITRVVSPRELISALRGSSEDEKDDADPTVPDSGESDH
ncbi:MAG: flippase [Actinomycetia bacterium]|nr:flippase [Actinomycetes bacterium]MCH9801032.1 flippase [Actinomycetes bacterium]